MAGLGVPRRRAAQRHPPRIRPARRQRAATSTGVSWSKNLWSLGARYNMAPDLAVYANAGSSFMVPAGKQIGGTVSSPTASGQLPNTSLKPESGIGRDLGVDWRPTRPLNLGLRALSQHHQQRHRQQRGQRHAVADPFGKRRQRACHRHRTGCAVPAVRFGKLVCQPDPHADTRSEPRRQPTRTAPPFPSRPTTWSTSA